MTRSSKSASADTLVAQIEALKAQLAEAKAAQANAYTVEIDEGWTKPTSNGASYFYAFVTIKGGKSGRMGVKLRDAEVLDFIIENADEIRQVFASRPDVFGPTAKRPSPRRAQPHHGAW